MTRSWTGRTALLLLSLVPGTGASASAQSPSTDSTASAQAAQEGVVNVSLLPISLRRIERQLRQASVREERDGLNLRFTIEVFGQAPRIELFTKQDNLLSGPVPYGGPSHRDILQVITPQEYRAPAADFGGLFRWLADKTKDKSDKR